MKVLILSATVGGGHNTCAKSISKGFEYFGVETKILDLYGYISPKLQEVIAKTYLLGIAISGYSFTRFLGEIGYQPLKKSFEHEEKFSIFKKIHQLIGEELLIYLEKEKPDIIVSTQVNCVNTINYLQEKGLTSALTVGVLTDFTVQSQWRNSQHIDYIVTAHKNLNYELSQIGVSLNKVLPFGIPIDPKFSKNTTQLQARQQLNISTAKKTVLILSGSVGYGKVEGMVKELDQLPLPFQLVIVCGQNKNLYQKLKSLKTRHPMKVYGFTKQLNRILDASDIVMTKPGGISISECLAKGKPIILCNAIPGMEDRNANFLVNQGLALNAMGFTSPKEALFRLFYDKNLLQQMKRASDNFGSPFASLHLANHLIQKSEQKTRKLLKNKPL